MPIRGADEPPGAHRSRPGSRIPVFEWLRRGAGFVLAFLFALGAARSVRADTLAQFRTLFGDIEVELFDKDKPVTVQNFIHYVESGRYQNVFSHRLVPGFVLQGGGFSVTGRGTTNWQIADVVTFPPITNEFGVGQKYSNTYGTIAMAKLPGDTNSASSQWFFNLTNNSYLDVADTNNFFVVFGRVVSGTNVLNRFNNFATWYYPAFLPPPQGSNLVLHQYYTSPFDDLPLLYPSVVDTNLLFVDITLLKVAVSPLAGGGREISWNSAGGLTNIVEFTTNMPPAWSTLVRTNGTGTRMTALDSAGSPRRFYRVRVDY